MAFSGPYPLPTTHLDSHLNIVPLDVNPPPSVGKLFNTINPLSASTHLNSNTNTNTNTITNKNTITITITITNRCLDTNTNTHFSVQLHPIINTRPSIISYLNLNTN